MEQYCLCAGPTQQVDMTHFSLAACAKCAHFSLCLCKRILTVIRIYFTLGPEACACAEDASRNPQERDILIEFRTEDDNRR